MTEHPNKLIILAGPTAVGKTRLAIDLAKQLNTEIISCDSRQVYQELNIGVARPSANELKEVPHHLIAHRSIHDDYNAGMFAEEVNTLLTALFEKHDTVIMTGGTGLYIKAITHGFDPLPTRNEELRQQLQAIFKQNGIEALQVEAEKAGLDLAEVEKQNPQRLIRAIEIRTGKVMGRQNEIQKNYATTLLYIDRDRPELYQRINLRVEQMIEEGLEEEARQVYPYRMLNALQTVGYSELFDHFEGKMSRENAIAKIKQHTRNYAKRQLTWFRNQGFTRVEATLDDILNKI